ncbi:MAG: hypothetical protein KatS3mg115_0996 [Candidatus Poribacteria bacterium]|nr:MAG: hypothetical protein KatS3mg115_0996 [Candidatus Poribacteria bacterium]
MAEEKLRVVHVGTGGRGRWPLEVIGNDPRFESVALVDINENFLAAARQATGLPESACFRDLEQAVRSVPADLMIICTPTATHAPFARIGFAHGLHVLTEKGMTQDWPTAIALVREAQEAGVKFCVSQNYRYFPVEQTMKTLFGTEKYGTPAFMDLIHHRYRPEPRTLNYKNAMLWDMSCHHFDNLVFWFGPAESVIARTFSAPWSKYAPHDAGVSAVITFQNGVTCTYSLTHIGQNNWHRTWIHTTTGTLRAHDVRGIEYRPINSNEAEAVPLLEVPRSEQGVINDVYRYITEGVEPGISGRNNLTTLAIIEACGRSHERNAAVELAEVMSEVNL